MGLPLISIIVPVYNTEQYLERCIQSVLNQLYTNWELLLVDDGSTDRSGAICDKYAMEDERIRVFHKPNGGVSAARNIGLDHSKGEYIAFLDSDDWISEFMYKEMYEILVQENADIVYCDICMVFQNEQNIWQPCEYVSDKVKFLNSFIGSEWTPLWNVLVKKELFLVNEIRNPEGVSFCEDYHVVTRLMLYASKVGYIPKAFYYYNRANENSALHNLHHKHFENERWVNVEMINLFHNKGMYDDFAKTLSWRLLKSKKELILNHATFDKFQQIYPETHKYIWSCPWINWKVKIIMWSVSKDLRVIARILLYIRSLKQGLLVNK